MRTYLKLIREVKQKRDAELAAVEAKWEDILNNQLPVMEEFCDRKDVEVKEEKKLLKRICIS